MKKIAIYPGSFDPLTMGHVDIIQRALPLFDSIVICVSNSSEKKYLFSSEERKELIQECFQNDKIQVSINEGLTVQKAKEVGATYIVRGIRTYMDMEYEKTMDTMNRTLYPDIETVFLFASNSLSNISSSLVKEVASLKGNVSNFVPSNVLKALLKKTRS